MEFRLNLNGMSDKIRNRKIRPSSRLAKSKNYKIDTKNIDKEDTLIVNITHESRDFVQSYRFNGEKVAHKNSISFKVLEASTHIDISWRGAVPDGAPSKKKHTKSTEIDNLIEKKILEDLEKEGLLKSLEPIVDDKSQVLILGTMPGVDSLKKQEYYGHSGNLFWKILGEVLNIKFPEDYLEKKEMLLKHHITVWDMLKTCFRPGSLDVNITDEYPNDIKAFIEDHPQIRAIAFNGKDAAKYFGKHIRSIEGIKLISLPSTSPANAGTSMEEKLKKWGQINDYL